MSERGSSPQATEAGAAPAQVRKRRWWTAGGIFLLLIIALLIAGRLALPTAVHWYVNGVINQDPLYTGQIEDVDLHLWRGAYSIKSVRLNKVTGNVPVPFFQAERLDLALQWRALLHGRMVGRVLFVSPELHFVDADDQAETQTGANGPWLDMIEDLFPFKINRAVIQDGSIYFHAFHKDPPVDLELGEIQGTIDNLTNIRDETAPLLATVTATGRAMGHAEVEFAMRLDPFSYRPTFDLAVTMIGLDATRLNDLTLAYGAFDFEQGWFDLVVELDAREGVLNGYVKPLFRDLKVFRLRDDLKVENVLNAFWQALVGAVVKVFENPARDQFATKIPLTGDLAAPESDLLTILGNVLRNAFIRAFLPRLEDAGPDMEGLQFGPGVAVDPELETEFKSP